MSEIDIQQLENVNLFHLMAICFAANIAFVTPELALVTLEWTFAAVGKLVSGYGATLSTAVLALVTPEWVFATVGSTVVLVLVTHIYGRSPLCEGLDSNL